MNKFEYTVTTNRLFPEAVEAVEKKTAEMDFGFYRRTISRQLWRESDFPGSR